MTAPRAPRAALALALCAVAATGCAASDDATPSTSAPAAAEQTAAPTPEQTASAGVDPATVTCEQLVPEDVLTAFQSNGWSVEEEPFRVASLELADGVWCKWGDFSGAATGSTQIYGWSPVSDDDARQAQDELREQGWVSETAEEGVYVTEDPDTVVSSDENGYGMTFLFADGWVTVSDTKQGLLVVQVPGA